MRLPLACLAFLYAAILVGGCERRSDNRVVLYTSIDEPVAAPILADFRKQTGIQVDIQTDTEATRSAGLAARLLAERDNPHADVWWGNEIFRTINLAEAGVLTPYESPTAADIPARFKDPAHRWAGSAMRARMMALKASADDAQQARAMRFEGLTDPMFKGQIAMALPTAGTTGGHVAALYVLWGDAKATRFFRALHDNDIKLLGGNSVVADQVGQGNLALGVTDNDDAEAAARAGGSLRTFLPDQDTFGTLVVPCTVGLVSGAKHPDAAKKLVDYLLSPAVERRLIEARFARCSVRAGGADAIKTMDVDYRAVARVLDVAANKATALMQGRQ